MADCSQAARAWCSCITYFRRVASEMARSISVLIDSSAGDQEYYEDCSVCCAPILFLVSETSSGEVLVTIKREDE